MKTMKGLGALYRAAAPLLVLCSSIAFFGYQIEKLGVYLDAAFLAALLWMGMVILAGTFLRFVVKETSSVKTSRIGTIGWYSRDLDVLKPVDPRLKVLPPKKKAFS